VWPNCGPASIPCSILINRFQTLQAGSTKLCEWGTSVHREHRGHKLGLATKAVNLRAVQTARKDLTVVITQNGETNEFMVSINQRMGFRPVEVAAEFVKRL
jgi:hypothetical protein